MKKLIGASLGVALLSSVFATGVEAAKPSVYTQDVYATLKAGSLLSEKELNRYLTNAGYPAEVISILELEQKQDIYNEQAVYAYHKKQTGNLQDGGNGTPELQNGLESVSIEQMNNFTGTLIASRVATPSVYGKVEYLLDFNWDWNYNAMVGLMDKFGVAWTDDFNAYANDTAKYSYRAFGKSQLTGNLSERSTGVVTDYSEGGAAGIGWEYDILDFFYVGTDQMDTYRHKGWGQVKIGRWADKYRAGNYEQTQAVGTYFHKQLSFHGVLSFDGTRPAVGIDATTSYDKSDDILSDPFSWMHYSY